MAVWYISIVLTCEVSKKLAKNCAMNLEARREPGHPQNQYLADVSYDDRYEDDVEDVAETTKTMANS